MRKLVCVLSSVMFFTCWFPMRVLAIPFSDLFVFGDSLSDIGNVLAATTANNLPSPPFSPIAPAPDTAYFQGRASNGLLYIDHVAQNLGLPIQPSLLGGHDFAFGGARTRTQLLPLIIDGSMNGQLAAYKSQTAQADPNALYVVFGGVNNFQDALIAASAPGLSMQQIQQIIGAAVANTLSDVRSYIVDLHSLGAHFILVPNAPNIGSVPRVAEAGPQAVQLGTILSQQYNAGLIAMLNSLLGPAIIEFDTFAFQNTVINNPGAFGFTDVTHRCYTGDDLRFTGGGTTCNNPDEFFFWDGIHPTAHGHALLGEAITAAVLAAVPEPASIALFALGLASLSIIVFRRRRSGSPRWSSDPLHRLKSAGYVRVPEAE